MAALTQLPPNSRTGGRRHSDPTKNGPGSFSLSGKGRASSSSSASSSSTTRLEGHPNREAVMLPSVPENAPILQEDISPEDAKAKRRSSSSQWAKRLSWIPGWTFAGSQPISPPQQAPNPLERTNSEESYLSNNTRMSRLRSSISTLSEVVLRDTEPSHEANFPENPRFPESDGQAMLLHVYGTIDNLNPQNMRLQIPRGFAYADFSGPPPRQYQALLEYVRPQLRDGDMLVRPFIERYARDRSCAMVIRGAIQDCVFKCMIIGLFPMKMFVNMADGKTDVKFESYELEVQMYDPGMAVALGQV
ncbi:hypothetical protein CERZMDRAFT_90837 [Cercospora zeae-maydis SCOH1-5]|uniref:Uncharacterized protein n=1 Tax=Cercospora zeae-maydis SCOH1-5 TaxID=717836 RepID=A0A6A6FFD6_9PEZI|nr:hypothetical protein CERZMDRAFT_90837 [Cercospora zeae-maydis SCOH1-5]